MAFDLNRFVTAQQQDFARALLEIQTGRKRSHWMWYIFPQLKGLGISDTAQFYGIEGIAEATAYLQHPLLGNRLIEISNALLLLEGVSAQELFGFPDDLKLKSSMTLFSQVPGADDVFNAVLLRFFGGLKDERTMDLLRQS